MSKVGLAARLPWRAGLLVVGLVAAGLVLRHLPGRDALASQGIAAYLGEAAILCAVGVPRQVVAFAGGYGFGALPGAGLSLAAQMLGCAVDLGWARLVGRDWARARLAGRFARLDAFLQAHPFTATLTLRLLPVGSNVLLNLAAGVTGLAAPPFLAATLIGYLPQTVVFALLGSGTRVERTTQLALGVVLLVCSVGLGLWLLRRRRLPF